MASKSTRKPVAEGCYDAGRALSLAYRRVNRGGMNRSVWRALLLLAILVTGLPLQAQTDAELEQGRALYRDGLSLEAAGDWAGALQKFEQVARVRLTPQVRFHIARCKEYLGRWTEALGDYRLAEYEATQIGAKEQSQIAEARALLEERVPKLVINAVDGSQVSRLSLDGVELGRSRLGAQLAVNPGPHRITVVYTGGASRNVDVNVQERALEHVRLPLSPEGPPAGTGAGDAGAPAVPGQQDTVRSWWPWILAGSGVASLGAAGVFLYLREDAEDELQRVCGPPPGPCPESMTDTHSRGALYARLAPIAGAVGVTALAGAAATWWMTSRKPRDSQAIRTTLKLDFVATPRTTGVQLEGHF